MRANTTLREFYASGHDIGVAGAKAFADMLAENATLAKLCVGHAGFGDEGVAALCAGLALNTGVCAHTWRGAVRQ